MNFNLIIKIYMIKYVCKNVKAGSKAVVPISDQNSIRMQK